MDRMVIPNNKQVQSNLYLEVTFGTKQKWSFKTGDFLKRGSIHMKFSMTGQENDDLLIQVIAWTGLTLYMNNAN